jgi:hypothetical protein
MNSGDAVALDPTTRPKVQNRAIEGPRKLHETRELQQRMVDMIVRYLERMTIEVRSKHIVID